MNINEAVTEEMVASAELRASAVDIAYKSHTIYPHSFNTLQDSMAAYNPINVGQFLQNQQNEQFGQLMAQFQQLNAHLNVQFDQVLAHFQNMM
jgi:hypothetical protein